MWKKKRVFLPTYLYIFIFHSDYISLTSSNTSPLFLLHLPHFSCLSFTLLTAAVLITHLSTPPSSPNSSIYMSTVSLSVPQFPPPRLPPLPCFTRGFFFHLFSLACRVCSQSGGSWISRQTHTQSWLREEERGRQWGIREGRVAVKMMKPSGQKGLVLFFFSPLAWP